MSSLATFDPGTFPRQAFRDIRRKVFASAHSAGSLRRLQANGILVEEFSITGLDNIFPLDAGDVELPPAP